MNAKLNDDNDIESNTIQMSKYQIRYRLFSYISRNYIF